MGRGALEQDRHEAALPILSTQHERVRRARIARPVVLATVLELKRGVFHAHVVVGDTTLQPRRARAVSGCLDELRGEYGFGTSKQGGLTGGARQVRRTASRSSTAVSTCDRTGRRARSFQRC